MRTPGRWEIRLDKRGTHRSANAADLPASVRYIDPAAGSARLSRDVPAGDL